MGKWVFAHGKKNLENENKEASWKLGMCETWVPLLLMILAQYIYPSFTAGVAAILNKALNLWIDYKPMFWSYPILKTPKSKSNVVVEEQAWNTYLWKNLHKIEGHASTTSICGN
jgi:hypothetical protein